MLTLDRAIPLLRPAKTVNFNSKSRGFQRNRISEGLPGISLSRRFIHTNLYRRASNCSSTNRNRSQTSSLLCDRKALEAFLTKVKEPTSHWAKLREAVLKTKKEIARQESVPGQPAPELDGAFWLNTEKPTMSLIDFRGKYVLLAFGGGGYNADVKLLHETYKDRGLAVVGIQDYLADADAVRARSNQNGLTFPMMIDHRDRRTVAAYERIGAVRGYPSYVLVGPDGKIVETRAITNYKFEYIRNYLLGGGQKSQSRE